MGLLAMLVGCWIDLSDLDGDTRSVACSGGAAPVTWFRDADGDGYGNDAEPRLACDPPMGHSTVGGDCDETDAAINPATAETCNGADDDCDFQVDESGASWCNDMDLDGHGEPEEVIYACEAPSGYVGACDDCDDGDATSFPGAPELSTDDVVNDCEARP
jgi:hypothetical protein